MRSMGVIVLIMASLSAWAQYYPTVTTKGQVNDGDVVVFDGNKGKYIRSSGSTNAGGYISNIWQTIGTLQTNTINATNNIIGQVTNNLAKQTLTNLLFQAWQSAQVNTNAGFQALHTAQANTNAGFRALHAAQGNTNAGFQALHTAQGNTNAGFQALHAAQGNTNAGFQALHTAQAASNAYFQSQITSGAVSAAQAATNALFQGLHDAQGNTNAGFQFLFDAQVNTNAGFQAFRAAQTNLNNEYAAKIATNENAVSALTASNTYFQGLHDAQGDTNTIFEGRISSNEATHVALLNSNLVYTAFRTNQINTNLVYTGFITNQANTNAGFQALHTAQANTNAAFQGATNALNTATGTLGTAVAALQGATNALNTATGTLGTAVAGLQGATNALNTATGTLGTAVAGLQGATNALNTATGTLGTAVAGLQGATNALNTATGTLGTAVAGLQGATNALNTATGTLGTAVAGLQGATNALNTATGTLGTAVALVQGQVGGISNDFIAADAGISNAINALAFSQSPWTNTVDAAAYGITNLGDIVLATNGGDRVITVGEMTNGSEANGKLLRIQAGVTWGAYDPGALWLFGGRRDDGCFGEVIIAGNILRGWTVSGEANTQQEFYVDGDGVKVDALNATNSVQIRDVIRTNWPIDVGREAPMATNINANGKLITNLLQIAMSAGAGWSNCVPYANAAGLLGLVTKEKRIAYATYATNCGTVAHWIVNPGFKPSGFILFAQTDTDAAACWGMGDGAGNGHCITHTAAGAYDMVTQPLYLMDDSSDTFALIVSSVSDAGIDFQAERTATMDNNACGIMIFMWR